MITQHATSSHKHTTQTEVYHAHITLCWKHCGDKLNETEMLRRRTWHTRSSEAFQCFRRQLDVWVRLVGWNWIWKPDLHFEWQSFVGTGSQRSSNHLGWGLVCGRTIHKACHRLTAHALEVYVTTLRLLLLPRHVHKRPLRVIVDHCIHQQHTCSSY